MTRNGFQNNPKKRTQNHPVLNSGQPAIPPQPQQPPSDLPAGVKTGNPLAWLKHVIAASHKIPPIVRRHIDRYLYDIGSPQRLSIEQAHAASRIVLAELEWSRVALCLLNTDPTSRQYGQLAKAGHYWTTLPAKLNGSIKMRNMKHRQATRMAREQSTTPLWNSETEQQESDAPDDTAA